MTRSVYALTLLIGVIAACLCLSGHVEEFLLKMPRLFHNRDLQRLLGWNRIQNGTTNTRQSFVGYSGAYRICFAFAVFHLFMALILFRTQTKQDLRNGLQNGFWFFKIVSIIGLIVTNFLWPIDEFNRSLRKENKFR